jgi:hypothetical protein
MKHLKIYRLFESKDLKWSDRDVTNKYHCALGWVRYTKHHKDSYIDIEKYFDITWDHLGWILEDFVDNYDLLYHCSVRDSRGMMLSHEDSDGVADSITIEFTPEIFNNNNVINFRRYILATFMNRENDILSDLLEEIETKLEDDFRWLTIKNGQGNFCDWNLFVTSSQITLKIKRR